jgi:hypothetical protein
MNVQSLCNKASIVTEFIVAKGLKLLLITETWLRNEIDYDNAVLLEACPEGFLCVNAPREVKKKGGGLALIFHPTVKIIQSNHKHSFRTFELSLNLLQLDGVTLAIALIYRPPHTSITEFISELDELSSLLTSYSEIIMLGDFNLPFNSVEALNGCLADLLHTHGLSQLVTHPTHNKGNILDLVLTRSTSSTILLGTQIVEGLSDHAAVLFTLNHSRLQTKQDTIRFRRLKNINPNLFHSDLYRMVNLPVVSHCYGNSDDCLVSSTATIIDSHRPLHVTPALTYPHSIDRIVDCFTVSIGNVLDKHAPVCTGKRPIRKLLPWWSTDTMRTKRVLRKIERRWRSSRLEVHRLEYLSMKKQFHRKINSAKRQFLTEKFQEHAINSKAAWSQLLTVLGRKNPVTRPQHQDGSLKLATEFNEFLLDKPQALRRKLASLKPAAFLSPPDFMLRKDHSMDMIEAATAREVERVIKNSPHKTSRIDAIPTRLLVSYLPAILPSITLIINKVLEQGMPSTWKMALVTPILKKANLNVQELGNYRPVSNLIFLSKVAERLVAKRLSKYLCVHDLYDPQQAAYRRNHSCESALTCLTDTARRAMDNRRITVLMLLDMSAAFDCVDHAILIKALESIGIKGAALRWFENYLSNRHQSVVINDEISPPRVLKTGVPQGSVLGPLLFIIYMLGIRDAITSHKFDYLIYADDIQIFTSTTTDELPATLKRLEACVASVSHWLASRRLFLNGNKTELILLGQSRTLAKCSPCSITVEGSTIHCTASVRSLGVILDQSLTMELQVNKIRMTSFAGLRLISRIRNSIDKQTCTSLVRALVLSHLEFCASLLSGCCLKVTKKLTTVINASLRIIERRRKTDSVSDLYYSLRLLPVQQHIQFRLLLLVYKALTTGEPAFVANLLKINQPVRALRSQDQLLLEVPFTYTKKGDCAFSVCAPKLWNSLDHSICRAGSFVSFRERLHDFLLTGLD